MLSLGLLAHYADAETLREERHQQEMAASFATRSLSVRIETYQRVLQSMGQGLHSSMLDTPYLLELLLREEAGYAGIFDTLVMTGSDGNMVSYAASGGTPEGGSALRDSLRRTLSDGKPQVGQIPPDSAAPQLGLLLTVPLRQPDGGVRGALAGLVRISLASVLPQPAEGEGQQFLLLDQDDTVLAQSATPGAQAAFSPWLVQLSRFGTRWASLSSPSTPNADSQQWGTLLVTRVGLPLPRWQVVALRDLSPRLLSMQRLTAWQWAGLVGLALSAAMALLVMLRWLSRPLARRWLPVASPAPEFTAEGLSTEGPRTVFPPAPLPPGALYGPEVQWQALLQERDASVRQGLGMEAAFTALLDALPQGAIWARGQAVYYATRRAAVLLGRDGKALAGQTLEQLLLHQPGARQWMQQARVGMAGFGRYRAALAWQPGAAPPRWLQVECMPLPTGQADSLWLLVDGAAQQQRRQQADWLHTHDALTGLPLQRQALVQLQAWQSAARAAVSAAAGGVAGQALLWVEVDYVAVLQATAGRAAGDEVLRQVAWLLESEQGAQGMAARAGTEGFVLWLPQAPSAAHVQTLAWRLCETVQAWAPQFGRQTFALGLSIGWLWVDPADAAARPVQALLQAAETACRAAQRGGQGQAVQARLPDTQKL